MEITLQRSDWLRDKRRLDFSIISFNQINQNVLIRELPMHNKVLYSHIKHTTEITYVF